MSIKSKKRSFGKTRADAENSLILLRHGKVSLSMVPYHLNQVVQYREEKKEVAVKAFLGSFPNELRIGQFKKKFDWCWENWDRFRVKPYDKKSTSEFLKDGEPPAISSESGNRMGDMNMISIDAMKNVHSLSLFPFYIAVWMYIEELLLKQENPKEEEEWKKETEEIMFEW